MTDYQRMITTAWWVHNAHDLRAPRERAANDLAGVSCVSPAEGAGQVGVKPARYSPA